MTIRNFVKTAPPDAAVDQVVSRAELVADLLRSGYPVRFRVTGRSMTPAIRHGETVIVAPVSAADLRPGDVALYARGKRVFAHRLLAVVQDQGKHPSFLLRGDNMPDCDRPVGAEAILGKLVQVKRFWGPVSLEDAPLGRA